MQRAPLLFSYLQTRVDQDLRPGSFILTGSQQFGLLSGISQTLAGRAGLVQLLNLSTLASDCGISHHTAAAWLSVLEASYIVFLLRPHFQNFNKRLVKTPKLYFCDTGLASWLLGIRAAEQLAFHAQRGALFENLVVAEFLKARSHQGQAPDLFFWRDSQGLEVDLLAERGGELRPLEIKSGQTIAADFCQGLNRWRDLAHQSAAPAWLIYGGDQPFRSGTVEVIPWAGLPELACRL